MESGKHISIGFAQVINLVQSVNWHRERCHESCNVALYLLRLTAESLLKDVWISERAEAQKLIDDTNWS